MDSIGPNKTQFEKSQLNQKDVQKRTANHTDVQLANKVALEKEALQSVNKTANHLESTQQEKMLSSAPQKGPQAKETAKSSPKLGAAQTEQTAQTNSLTSSGKAQSSSQQPLPDLSSNMVKKFATVIKQEIRDLNQMLTLFVKSGNPDLQKLAKDLTKQLQQLKYTEPDYPEDALETLDKILNQMNKEASKLPESEQFTYWSFAQGIYSNVINQTKEMEQAAQSQTASQAEASLISKSLKPIVDKTNKLLQKLAKGETLTRDELKELGDNLITLKDVREQLTGDSEMGDEIDNLFETLEKDFQAPNGTNLLAESLAKYYTYESLNQYVKKHPDATMEEASKALLNNAMKFNSGGMELFEDVKRIMGQEASNLTTDTQLAARYLSSDSKDYILEPLKRAKQVLSNEQLQDVQNISRKFAEKVNNYDVNRGEIGKQQQEELEKLEKIREHMREELDDVSRIAAGHAPLSPEMLKLLGDSINKEVNGMIELIDYLIGWGPKDASDTQSAVSAADIKELKKLKNDLIEIKNRTPNYTEQDLTKLPQVLTKMNMIADKMGSKKGAGEYWSRVSGLYEDLGATLSSYLEKSSATLDQADQAVKNLDTINSLVQDVLKDLPLLFGNADPSAWEIRKFSDHLIKLLALGADPSTPESVKEALKNLCMNFVNLPEPFYSSLANGFVGYLIETSSGGNSEKISKDVLEQLNQMISSLESQEDPLSQSLVKELKNVRGDFQTHPNQYIKIVNGKPAVQNQKIQQIKEQFMSSDAQKMPTGNMSFALNNIQEILKSAKSVATDTKNEHEKIAGALDNLTASMEKDQEISDAKSFERTSLADMFMRSILGSFMPKQEAFLQDVATKLTAQNKGANVTNQILGKMIDFSQSLTNFDFNNGLSDAPNSKDGTYSGNFADRQADLNDEIDQAKRDLKNCDSALEEIKNQRKEIQDDTKLTPDQKKELLDKLDGYEGNLKVAKDQLNELVSILGKLEVVPEGNNKFSIKGPAGWQSAVRNAENSVVHGNANKNPSGGLMNIQQDISNDQQNYSNQGQQAQMELQLRMTELQQEWTIVSTAMNLLNQMYMTVAQGINK